MSDLEPVLAELKALRAEMQADIQALRVEMRAGFAEVADVLTRHGTTLNVLRMDMADVKADVRAIHHHMAGFSEEVHSLRLRLTRQESA
jgi:hypothetical protein